MGRNTHTFWWLEVKYSVLHSSLCKRKLGGIQHEPGSSVMLTFKLVALERRWWCPRSTWCSEVCFLMRGSLLGALRIGPSAMSCTRTHLPLHCIIDFWKWRETRSKSQGDISKLSDPSPEKHETHSPEVNLYRPSIWWPYINFRCKVEDRIVCGNYHWGSCREAKWWNSKISEKKADKKFLLTGARFGCLLRGTDRALVTQMRMLAANLWIE